MTTARPLVIGAICARGGSKGVPRKNLRPLAGIPLIAHTILCARAASSLSRIVVSTDDEEIAAVARRWDVEVPFIRPASLACDDTSKWLVFRHLVAALEERDQRRVDVLVDLDTGVPMRTADDVDTCVDLLLNSDADVVTTAYEAERNPYFNMVEIHEGVAKIVKQPAAPIAARQAAPAVYSLSPAVFAIKRDVLWSVEHWSQARLQISILPRARAIDIDTEVDFDFVSYLMAQRSCQKPIHG